VVGVVVLLVVVIAATPLPSGPLVRAQASPGEPGRLGWYELLTEDADAAAAFYASLFDWQIERDAVDKYRVRHDGTLIAGITEIERSDPDVDESTWLVGVAVADVRASVATARREGARVLRDVTGTTSLAQWAVVEDPQGAQVLLLATDDRVEATPEPGRWIWAELWTHDAAAASRFYAEVVGWTLVDVDHPDGSYPTFQWAGEPRAGLVPIEEGEMETGWAPYIGVADLGSTVARARELGGRVLLEPSDKINGGLVAILADPTGVGFLIFQLGGAR
jgi:hypothetical protein